MSSVAFLDPETGPFKRIDNSAWFIKKLKKKNNEFYFFLDMKSKFQQMPTACFELTAERTPELNREDIKKEIQKFKEVHCG